MKTASPEEIEKGIERIRRLRRGRAWVFLSFVPVMGVVGLATHSEIAFGIAAIAYVPVLVALGIKLLLVPCPRCRCEFHLTGIRAGWQRECGNCGLSLDQRSRPFFW
jgi:hypothetical protein